MGGPIILQSSLDGLYRIDVHALWKSITHRTAPDHAAILIYRSIRFNSSCMTTSGHLKQKLQSSFPIIRRQSRLINGAYPQHALWCALNYIHRSAIYSAFTDEEKDLCQQYIKEIKHSYGTAIF